MKISRPEIVRDAGEVVYRAQVEWHGVDTLWFRVDERYEDFVSERSDAALVALLIPAMARGEDIQVEGVVSAKLLFNVAGPYQRLLRHVIPWLKPIAVRADVVDTSAHSAAGVATGFSGGVDSFSALADHYYSPTPTGYKVTHLLFNNVGSHGKAGDDLFRERMLRVTPFAEQIGLPLIVVNSNVDSFYGKGLHFQQTHTPRNASVPLFLQNGIGRFLYASSYSFPDIRVGPSRSMALTDSLALPMLASESVDAICVGAEYTRVEKTVRIAGLPHTYTMLDVCVSGRSAGNCATCKKCLRTLLTLDIAGALERYAPAFNLNAYRKVRSKFIGSMLRSDEPLLREIAELAQERNFAIPPAARAYSWLAPPIAAAKWITRLPRRVARKLIKKPQPA